ncbi:MAG: hypothetical protein R2692_09540 [Microbacterium sp.]
MKTNFLGDSGQNTFTVTQEVGPAADLDAERRRAEGRGGAHRHRRRRDRADLDRVERLCDPRRVLGRQVGRHLLDHHRSRAPTRSPAVRETFRRRSPTSTSRHPPDRASGQGGFGSSDIEVGVTAPSDALQTATDAVVAGLDGKARHRPGDLEPVGVAAPYVAVSVDRTRPPRSDCRRSPSAPLVSNTMQPRQAGTVEIDGTTLTVYLQAASVPKTIDELKALPIASGAGLMRLDQSKPSSRVKADLDHDAARQAHRDGHRHPRPTTSTALGDGPDRARGRPADGRRRRSAC